MTPKREIYVLVNKAMPEDSDYEKSYAALNTAPAPQSTLVGRRRSWTARIAQWLGVDRPREPSHSGDFSRFGGSRDGHDDASGPCTWDYFDEAYDPDEHPSRPAA